MRPPEFGSLPSNEMGFPRKNAARRARGISFEGNLFTTIRIYKIWGSSYKGSPPKIVSLRAAQGFFRCAVRQHGASTKIPRSPFPREAEPGTPFPPRGKRCVLRMRSAPARASFKTLAGGAYIQTKMAPRAARTSCARAGVSIFYAEKRGSLYETPEIRHYNFDIIILGRLLTRVPFVMV